MASLEVDSHTPSLTQISPSPSSGRFSQNYKLSLDHWDQFFFKKLSALECELCGIHPSRHFPNPELEALLYKQNLELQVKKTVTCPQSHTLKLLYMGEAAAKNGTEQSPNTTANILYNVYNLKSGLPIFSRSGNRFAIFLPVTMIHAIVTSRLVYCSLVCSGLPLRLAWKLYLV